MYSPHYLCEEQALEDQEKKIKPLPCILENKNVDIMEKTAVLTQQEDILKQLKGFEQK